MGIWKRIGLGLSTFLLFNMLTTNNVSAQWQRGAYAKKYKSKNEYCVEVKDMFKDADEYLYSHKIKTFCFNNENIADKFIEKIPSDFLGRILTESPNKTIILIGYDRDNANLKLFDKKTGSLEVLLEEKTHSLNAEWAENNKIYIHTYGPGQESKSYLLDIGTKAETKLEKITATTWNATKNFFKWEFYGTAALLLYGITRRSLKKKQENIPENISVGKTILDICSENPGLFSLKSFAAGAVATSLYYEGAKYHPLFADKIIAFPFAYAAFNYLALKLVKNFEGKSIPHTIHNMIESIPEIILYQLSMHNKDYDSSLDSISKIEKRLKNDMNANKSMIYFGKGDYEKAIERYIEYTQGLKTTIKEENVFEFQIIKHGSKIFRNISPKPNHFYWMAPINASLKYLRLHDFITEFETFESVNCQDNSSFIMPEMSCMYAEFIDEIKKNWDSFEKIMSIRKIKKLRQVLEAEIISEEKQIPKLLERKAAMQWSRALKNIIEYRNIDFERIGESKNKVGLVKNLKYYENKFIIKVGEERTALKKEADIAEKIAHIAEEFNQDRNRKYEFRLSVPKILHINEENIDLSNKELDHYPTHYSSSEKINRESLISKIINQRDHTKKGFYNVVMDALEYFHDLVSNPVKEKPKKRPSIDVKGYVLAMEREEGDTLADIIERKERDTSDIYNKVIESLAYIHVKLDVKEDNFKEKGYDKNIKEGLINLGIDNKLAKDITNNLEPIKISIQSSPKAFHKDSSPMNWIITPEENVCSLDNEYKRIDVVQADLAKLINFHKVNSHKEDMLIQEYYDAFKRYSDPGIDFDSFRLGYFNSTIKVGLSVYLFIKKEFKKGENYTHNLINNAIRAIGRIKEDYNDFYQRYNQNYDKLEESLKHIDKIVSTKK